MVADGNKVATRPLTSRQDRFALILAGGASQAESWRQAYAKPDAKDTTAAQRGSRLAADPRIQAKVSALKATTAGGVLLTVNDRLHLLSESARQPAKTAGERSARARLIDVYTKLAGGAQPEQHQITGPGGGPILATVTAAVTVHRAPVRERLAALRAAKDARG